MTMPCPVTTTSAQGSVSGCRTISRKRQFSGCKVPMPPCLKAITVSPGRKCPRQTAEWACAGRVPFSGGCWERPACRGRNRNGLPSGTECWRRRAAALCSGTMPEHFPACAAGWRWAIRKRCGCGGWHRRWDAWRSADSITIPGCAAGAIFPRHSCIWQSSAKPPCRQNTCSAADMRPMKNGCCAVPENCPAARNWHRRFGSCCACLRQRTAASTSNPFAAASERRPQTWRQDPKRIPAHSWRKTPKRWRRRHRRWKGTKPQ